MRSPRSRSALASPVLVGAVTVLVVLVAVFLSYNANRGLPFVPTKELRVDIANGANLVPGNDVREGGFRIGLISQMKPIELPNGAPGAQLILKLDQAHDRVPVDSTATIDTRSVTGLKYVTLNVGTSNRIIPDGGVLPVGQTTVPVQNDDVYKMFDPATRRAVDQDFVGYGDALTGRGSSLNDTIAALPSFLGHLQPVAHYLSQPENGLLRFFRDTEQFMRALAPVAGVNARLFGDQATTFGAIDRSPADLRATNALSPGTLDAGITSLRAQLPFLRDYTAFNRALAPGTVELRRALPDVVPAVEIGTRTLARTPALNHELQGVMEALKALALAPSTDIALNGLTATVSTLNPMLRYLGPYVSVCNYWNYWWTYLSEHISAVTTIGYAQRVLINTANSQQPDNFGSIPASAPANGQSNGDEFLKDPAYGAAIDTQGNADCETDQRGYVDNLNHIDPLHRHFDTDVHTPGSQGTTFTGIAHVPAGETFSRKPQTGPQLSYPASNP